MLNDRLKILRKHAGISQAGIASLLNITREAYSMYESGKRQPSCDTLLCLADFYKVNLDYLFGRANNPTPTIDMTEEERFLLIAHRKADDRGRQTIQLVAKFEYYRMEQNKISDAGKTAIKPRKKPQ